jgi:hypothetical protein
MQNVEMDDVIVLVLGAVHQVANQARVLGNLHADGVVDCPHRGQSMDVRSDPAGALHEMLGIPRISSLQDDFDAAEHLPGAPGVDDFASGHLDLDAEVPLDAGYRIDDDSLSHMISFIQFEKGYPTR